MSCSEILAFLYGESLQEQNLFCASALQNPPLFSSSEITTDQLGNWVGVMLLKTPPTPYLQQPVTMYTYPLVKLISPFLHLLICRHERRLQLIPYRRVYGGPKVMDRSKVR
jgi:hypothetical protein